MKNKLSLFLVLLLLSTSCGTERHLTSHPAVGKSGQKAQKAQQDRLASDFGGANLHRPNNFKKKHFPNRIIPGKRKGAPRADIFIPLLWEQLGNPAYTVELECTIDCPQELLCWSPSEEKEAQYGIVK